MTRFQEVWCSQCGRGFGPGDHGYSHCTEHRPKRNIVTTQHYSDVWTAVEDEYDLGCLTGYGGTEQEAINDLNEQLDDREDEQLRYQTETGEQS